MSAMDLASVMNASDRLPKSRRFNVSRRVAGTDQRTSQSLLSQGRMGGQALASKMRASTRWRSNPYLPRS